MTNKMTYEEALNEFNKQPMVLVATEGLFWTKKVQWDLSKHVFYCDYPNFNDYVYYEKDNQPLRDWQTTTGWSLREFLQTKMDLDYIQLCENEKKVQIEFEHRQRVEYVLDVLKDPKVIEAIKEIVKGDK